jgi:hypothetical protein
MGKWNGLSRLTNILDYSTQGSYGGLTKLELQFKKALVKKKYYQIQAKNKKQLS